jgi:hypothetical protein
VTEKYPQNVFLALHTKPFTVLINLLIDDASTTWASYVVLNERR